MKLAKSILAGAIAVASVSAAHADSTVYITGATAYRAAAVIAIENLYGGAGTYACVYGAKSGVTSEQNASHAAFRGSIPTRPALGVVTVKVAWAGSSGGLHVIADPTLNVTDQPGVLGWIPDANLPGGNTTVGTLETAITFESGAAAASANGAFSDAFQSTAGVSGLIGCGTDTVSGKVGVVPFEWVANNGVTNVQVISAGAYGAGTLIIPYTAVTGTGLAMGQLIGGKGIAPGTTIAAFTAAPGNITLSAVTTQAQAAASTISSATAGSNPITNLDPLHARAVLGGGAYLSTFTGVGVADASNVFVYAFGRNADSGTRISCLTENGYGLITQPQHVQPTITGGSAGGKGGLPSRPIASMARWPADTSLFTVLGVNFGIGQSGFSGGGDLADALTAWGSVGAPTTAGGTPLAFQSKVGFDGGWMLGYVSRGDAKRACAQTFGANTAHRCTFNGVQDWVGSTFKDDGDPVGGYNDTIVQEGLYTLWEFEHLYRNSGTTGTDAQTYLDDLAAGTIANDPGVVSIPVGSMRVSRSAEGGVISHVTTP